MGSSGVAPHSSATRSQISMAKSISVPVKDSGEYSNRISEPLIASRSCRHWRVPVTARSIMPARSMPYTTRRCRVEVGLYRCMMARSQPVRASKLREMSSDRDCVRTWTQTSSGISPSSIKRRQKSKSGAEAEGKPTSISLNPISTSASNICFLRGTSIGSISAWLPSRRSTEHQRGASVMALLGQVRSVRGGAYG